MTQAGFLQFLQGLPLNQGAEGGIQNAAMDGQDWIIYRAATDADPGTTEINLFTTTGGFQRECIDSGYGTIGASLIDVSKVSSVSIVVDVDFNTATSFDIIPYFYDAIDFLTWSAAVDVTKIFPYLATPDWALVGADSIITPRKTIFRIPGDIVPVVFSIPVPNARYMGIRGNANGGTITKMVLLVGRGYNTGVGIVPMI